MTKRLNQILAEEKGIRERFTREISDLHHLDKKAALFNGMSRSYAKKDEDGEDFPPETKRVEMNAADVGEKIRTIMSDLVDITATKDETNTIARADIVVGTVVIATAVPVSTMLFLEK